MISPHFTTFWQLHVMGELPDALGIVALSQANRSTRRVSAYGKLYDCRDLVPKSVATRSRQPSRKDLSQKKSRPRVARLKFTMSRCACMATAETGMAGDCKGIDARECVTNLSAIFCVHTLYGVVSANRKSPA
jgi:hypothetical protein